MLVGPKLSRDRCSAPVALGFLVFIGLFHRQELTASLHLPDADAESDNFWSSIQNFNDRAHHFSTVACGHPPWCADTLPQYRGEQCPLRQGKPSLWRQRPRTSCRPRARRPQKTKQVTNQLEHFSSCKRNDKRMELRTPPPPPHPNKLCVCVCVCVYIYI